MMLGNIPGRDGIYTEMAGFVLSPGAVSEQADASDSGLGVRVLTAPALSLTDEPSWWANSGSGWPPGPDATVTWMPLNEGIGHRGGASSGRAG